MTSGGTLDAHFRDAVAAIDAGDVVWLERPAIATYLRGARAQ